MCLVLASPSECDYGREKSGIKIFDLVRVITVKAKYCPQNISSSSIFEFREMHWLDRIFYS